MSLISTGIQRVRAFVIAAGVDADGRAFDSSFCVLVRWKSVHADKLHHVYVNGRLAGFTSSCEQKSLIVWSSCDSCLLLHVKVYAADGEYCSDYSSYLPVDVNMGCVRLKWIRSISLPFEAQCRVYRSRETDQVDYNQHVNNEPLWVWPSWQDEAGFGMSRFGLSDFGFDGSAAVGFGRGEFGSGEFGFDADDINWRSGRLETGVYKFAVTVIDENQNVLSPVETEELTVIEPALSTDDLRIVSYVKATDSLTIGTD